MDKRELKEKAKNLRKLGKTYSEINRLLNVGIPKSTLSYWCNGLDLPAGHKHKIQEYKKYSLIKARELSLKSRKLKREAYLKNIDENNFYLRENLKNKGIAKIALAALYLAEGSKRADRGLVTFSNSDSSIIKLFLYLLRLCYIIDEKKFRCTLQCRADQNIKELESFWSNITGISLNMFYKARIDPRSINKPSKKKDYKGVCRIDYLSAEVFIDLMSAAKNICEGR